MCFYLTFIYLIAIEEHHILYFFSILQIHLRRKCMYGMIGIYAYKVRTIIIINDNNHYFSVVLTKVKMYNLLSSFVLLIFFHI